MTKIYALFNSKGNLVQVGLTLGGVTGYLSYTLPTQTWDSLFGEKDPNERKNIFGK